MAALAEGAALSKHEAQTARQLNGQENHSPQFIAVLAQKSTEDPRFGNLHSRGPARLATHQATTNAAVIVLLITLSGARSLARRRDQRIEKRELSLFEPQPTEIDYAFGFSVIGFRPLTSDRLPFLLLLPIPNFLMSTMSFVGGWLSLLRFPVLAQSSCDIEEISSLQRLGHK